LHNLHGDWDFATVINNHLKLILHDLQQHVGHIFTICFGIILELLGDGTSQPIALIRTVRATPLILYGDGEGLPTV
jgi:hypothetical protein